MYSITLIMYMSLSLMINGGEGETKQMKSTDIMFPDYFPSHLRPYLHSNITDSAIKSTILMRYDTPQGMHVKFEVMGSVLFPHVPRHCQQKKQSLVDGKCYVNLFIVFDLPVGVFVDPYELQARHNFEWDNVVVHTSTSSLKHLSAEVFTQKASPFVLAVELLGTPLTPVEDLSDDYHRAFFQVLLPLHLRYSSQFYPEIEQPLATEAIKHVLSQCGPYRHKAHALVSPISSPLLFVSLPQLEYWAPGIGFAHSESLTDFEDKYSTKLYVRDQSFTSLQHMQEYHAAALYNSVPILGVNKNSHASTRKQHSLHVEYRKLLSNRVIDALLLENHLGRIHEEISVHNSHLGYFEDVLDGSCLYIPDADGDMKVYLHMPVPNPQHVPYVLFLTAFTILITTTLLVLMLMRPPVKPNK